MTAKGRPRKIEVSVDTLTNDAPPFVQILSAFKMSYTSYTSSAAADDDGWTRVSRSRFSDDAAAAFGRKQRPAESSYSSRYGFNEEAASAFGRRSAPAAPTERSSRSSGFAAAFNEEAASAFGSSKTASSHPRRRGEFDESATYAFGCNSKIGSRHYESSYRSTVATATPAKKQTYDEAFPTLGGSKIPATAEEPVEPIETDTRIPTLAEKLRKKAAEEAEAEERRKATADAAAHRHAKEAKERAMFASLSASRAYMSASHYVNHVREDTRGYDGEDDLDYGAFGEAVDRPIRRRVPTPVPDHEYEDEEAF